MILLKDFVMCVEVYKNSAFTFFTSKYLYGFRSEFRRSRCFGFLATGRQDEGEACGEREDFHGDLQGVTTFAGGHLA